MAIQKNRLELMDSFTLSDNNLVGYTDNSGKLVTGTLKRSATTNQYTLETPDDTLIFDNNGNCITQGKENIKLSNVSADIEIDPSKVQTRASDGSEVSVNSLVPIDQFAIAIIGSMLVNIKDSDTLSDAKILNLCNIAYKYAKGMIAISVNMRKANATGTSSGDAQKVKVDVSDLQSTSEKLLNNIVTSVDNLTTQIKTNDTNAAERYNNGIKVTQQGTVKIDNPTGDKFEVEGGSDGGIDYDKLNDISTNISSIVGFNNKAIGRTSLSDLATKIIALDTALGWLRESSNNQTNIWNTNASNISAALKSYIDSDIDAKINTLIKDYGLTKPTT